MVVVLGAMLASTLVMAQDTNKVDAAKSATVKTQTMCPILDGNKIDKSQYVDFEGKRIYVCCKGCLATVTKDPAKYVKEIEATGVTLDKVPAAAPASVKPAMEAPAAVK